jgi:hypothetical protein
MQQKYKVKDVVESLPEFGGRHFAILAIREGKYHVVSVKDKRLYWLEESQIRDKIGSIDDDSPLLEKYDAEEGAQHAVNKAEETKDSRWEMLAIARPGDEIEVIHRNTLYKGIFVQINVTKPVKVFRARINGIAHDMTIDSVYLEKKHGDG